jgi:hypothetical protein
LLLGRDSGCAEALLLNIVNHHLRLDERPVAYVSGWHSRERILDRLAYVRTGLDRFGRRRGPWTAREENAFREGRDQIAGSQLHFEDARRLRSLADVAASLRHTQEAHGLRFVALDNALWFSEGAGPKEPGAAAQALGRGLRDAAASLGIPLIAFCPVPWDMCREDSMASMQPALGPHIDILDHCVACLAVRYEDSNEGVSVQVEFHPTTSRGAVSFHRFDRRSSRISDWA